MKIVIVLMHALDNDDNEQNVHSLVKTVVTFLEWQALDLSKISNLIVKLFVCTVNFIK